MYLFEAVAFFEKENGEHGMIVNPTYVFAGTQKTAERVFTLENADVLKKYDIKEVTILVRPFA